MSRKKCVHRAFSLLELLAVFALLGVLVLLVMSRVYQGSDDAKKAACHSYKGDIEIQVELWRNNKGTMPAANLSDIGADPEYFPEGLPVCPVDSSGYTINTTTGLVGGHAH